ncbi:MAG: multicopper oxidase domain-containing protein, partial [Pseudomonadota bacterium]
MHHPRIQQRKSGAAMASCPALFCARQVDRISRLFRNALPQATTVHWQSIRIENEIDGVAGMTQTAVSPGDAFFYDFTLPDAGTYWYHPHNRTHEQMA